jgi:uncharacterized protein (TIGR03437 family)
MATFTPDLAPALRKAPSSAPRNFLGRWGLWFAGLLSLVAVFGFALLLRQLAEGLTYRTLSARVGLVLLDQVWRDIAECVAVLVCVGLGLLAPAIEWKRLRRVEQAISRFASHKTRTLVVIGLLPLLIRLALLPVLQVPEPLVADEFGYLLLADTFASGRITNPTHPLWKHFETIYVFHQPTYTSIYPIAPAVLMAIPKLVQATPWLGVWLAAGLMCMAICWMLQGWLPPKWAFLGGLLAVGRFAITGPWMNTYWGGAVAAIGGALAVGAMIRIVRYVRVRDSLLYGLGLAVLAHSRPYEGFLLSIPLSAALLIWVLRDRRVAVRTRLTRVVLPMALAAAALVAGTGYYNWRVTGSPLSMPYSLHQKMYGTPQSFFWQKPITDAPGIHRHKDLNDVFRWQLDAYNTQFQWGMQGERLRAFWHFYLQPLLTLPLLFLPLLWRRRRMRVVLISIAVVMVGNSLYPFFFPHYAAPLCGLLILVVMEGMRRLRTIRFRSRRVGPAICRYAWVLICVSVALTSLGGLFLPWTVSANFTPRAQALRELEERGGQHVVLVHYSRVHSFHYGVVYNDADIDHSPVVWAREMDPASNQELTRYFPNRDFWLLNPDEDPVRLVPFSGKPHISGFVGAPGKRDDVRDGLAPGQVATILGENFAHEISGPINPRAILGSLPVQMAAVSAEFGATFAPARERQREQKSAAPSPLPMSIRGVSVKFGDIPAPLFGLARFETQEAVTVQVPAGLRAGWTTVTLQAGGAIATRKVRILRAAPGIFQMRTSDAGLHAILLHPDGTMVLPEKPARHGEILSLFATGLGPYSVVVGVNHRGVRLVRSERAPSLVGVDRVTFEVPRDAPSGMSVPLAIAAVIDGHFVYGNRSSLPIE